MPTVFTPDDVLQHLSGGGADSTQEAPSLVDHVGSPNGTITLVSFAGCELVLKYNFFFDGIDLIALLDTPFGEKKLGQATLNRQHPSARIGGSFYGFKAEVEIEFDFETKILRLRGTLCAPRVGCKQGHVTIHV